MRRSIRSLVLITLALVAACTDSTAGPDMAATVTLRVTPDTGVYRLGDTVRVSAHAVDGQIFVDSASLRFASSDSSIVEVDAVSGLARVIAEGVATITASAPHARGSTTMAGALVRVESSVAPRTLTFGFNHGCGLVADGAAYCFGTAGHGELGVGNQYADATTPMPVSGGLHFSAIDADNWGTCGLTTDRLVYCWGTNSPGQRTYAPTRVIFGGDTALRAASVRSHGDGGGCVIDTGGGSWCWGNALYGALGYVEGEVRGRLTTPRPIPGGLTYAELKPGLDHSCGITRDGSLYCWGIISYFSSVLGPSPVPLPMRMDVPGPMHDVTTSWESGCALDASGAAWCFGNNDYGELGSGRAPTGARSQAGFDPEPVAGGHRFKSIEMFGHGACGLTGEGELWCWGQIARGVPQPLSGTLAGNGTVSTATVSAVPVLVSHTRHFIAFAVHSRSVCGVTAAGEIFCGSSALQGFPLT